MVEYLPAPATTTALDEFQSLAVTDAKLSATQWRTLATVAHWIKNYLCHPHDDLGRRGPVCPYASRALEVRGIQLVACDEMPPQAAALDALIEAQRRRFDSLPPADGDAALLRAIVLVFPPGEEFQLAIEAAQARHKSVFVEAGLMLGEFHPGPPDKPGLWNSAFRPLRSPLPLLAIRRMVATDLPFLHGRHEWLRAYLAHQGHQVPAHLHTGLLHACQRFGLAAPAPRLANEAEHA